jgi:DNA-binding MarR family transcriptional regulator
MRTAELHGAALDQLLELAILMNADMTQSLAKDGLTVARAHLLWELHQCGPSTQRVLAQALDVSPRNVTGLVDGLVATGFVARQPHPTDRRATLVSFTEQGARTVKEMDNGHKQLAESLFSEIPDKQFDALVEGLDVVLAQLRNEVSKAKASSQ